MEERFIDDEIVGNFQISAKAKRIVETMRKWARFITVLFLIFLALMFLFSGLIIIGSWIENGTLYPELLGEMAAVLVMLLMVLFPVFFLIRFNKSAKKLSQYYTSFAFEKTLNRLKNYFIASLIYVLLIASFVAYFSLTTFVDLLKSFA